MNMPHSVQVAALALAIGGCAAKTPPSLSGDAREHLGRIGVVAVAFAPEVSFSGPTALGGFGGGSKGALTGLGLGVLGGAGCFLTLGFGVDFCAVAVSTPYFIGRWSVEGALKAVPEQERRQGRDAIIGAAGEVTQGQLLEAVLGEGRRRKETAPVPLAAQGPTSRDQRSTYSGTPPEGVDSVVEVALLRIGLEGAPSNASPSRLWTASFASEVDPWLRVIAKARLRVVNVADDGVRYERTFNYLAGHAQLRDWARDDAAEFRKARAEAIEGLGRQIAEEVFGAFPRAP